MDLSIPLIIPTFDRPESLKRLLNSLLNANYDNYCVELIICIDYSGSFESQEIADKLDWPYGKKTVIKHKVNLGLRENILFCGNLSSEFDGIIILEDDCFVSKDFYHFAMTSFNFYRDDKNICGISLYAHEIAETSMLPFVPLKDNFDTFFMQVPSSWGQIWSKSQWIDFYSFYMSAESKIFHKDVHETICNWPETSWKKYFYNYMATKYKYFVYPYVSFLTNFNEAGVHCESRNTACQVFLRLGIAKNEMTFSNFNASLIKYDSHFEILPDCLIKMGFAFDQPFIVDLYNSKNKKYFTNEYILSLLPSKNKHISYSTEMRPLPNNITYKNYGVGISLSKFEDFILESPSTFTLKYMILQYSFIYNKIYYTGFTGKYNLIKNKIISKLKTKLKPNNRK